MPYISRTLFPAITKKTSPAARCPVNILHLNPAVCVGVGSHVGGDDPIGHGCIQAQEHAVEHL